MGEERKEGGRGVGKGGERALTFEGESQ